MTSSSWLGVDRRREPDDDAEEYDGVQPWLRSRSSTIASNSMFVAVVATSFPRLCDQRLHSDMFGDAVRTLPRSPLNCTCSGKPSATEKRITSVRIQGLGLAITTTITIYINDNHKYNCYDYFYELP